MAISEESYGRGRPVYGNGSFAPTSGTVDPSGYVDRSLNNPSDSRSGLAQAALAKLKGGAQVASPAPTGVSPLGDIKTLTLTPTGQLIPDNGMNEPPLAPPANGPIPPGLPSGGNLSPLAQAALSRLLASGSPVGSASGV